jgi:2-polyprenyl-3-methyl-5-hydroxy-6-metoxy-1,4-benzoquinol methylase
VRAFDRVLQRWRISKSRPYLPKGARVLDVGCADGALFEHLKDHLGAVVGIDPTLQQTIEIDRCRLIAGQFPDDLPDQAPFDAITMLAVLEHVPSTQQSRWSAACPRLLKPGGHLIITSPSPAVDRILALLKAAKLIDGMSLEEHYGFEPSGVPALFAAETLELVKAEKFQLGFNNLFVFRRTDRPRNASRSVD